MTWMTRPGFNLAMYIVLYTATVACPACVHTYIAIIISYTYNNKLSFKSTLYIQWFSIEVSRVFNVTLPSKVWLTH